MDRLVLDHHFALGTSATMADAANQIIQSDIDLYGGAHVGTLVTVFDTWGFVDATAFLPTITHTPLGDTENTTGPYVVTANITSTQPLDVSSLKVFFGTGVFFTDSLPLIPTGNSNEYSAAIPGPLSDVDVRYYLIAKDVNGGTATHPVGAPGSFHQFHVGSDLVPPVITHTAIGNFPEIQWPATVSATVTDNIGVNPDSVRVDWAQNGSPRQTFYLSRVGVTSQWSGPFPSDTTQVAIGDEIAYHITARDVAATPNVAVSPPVGDYAFTIIASRGTVLVLDDDELPKRATVKIVPGEKGGEPTLVEEGVRDIGTVGQSATSIAAALNSLGFTATVETAASSNPATWSSYGLLVSSSGANTSPVANAAYRSAIEAYVAGGGKLLVEGGEVVYDASTSPGYPTFASNVLHSTDWDADNAGALNLLAGQSGHPLAKTPNALPATLPIAYSGIGSEDSYKPTAPAYIVYGVTAQAGNGGILVYDPTPSPQSAQVVVLGFDYKVVSDATTRVKLLENAAEYLLRPEGSPSGTLHGRVVLAGQTDHSGVTVTAQPGGQTGVTNSSGDWQINGVYAFTYDLRATKAGFETGTNLGVVVPEGGSVQSDFVLYPQVSTSSCLSPGTAIPDNNPVGITSDMVVAPTFPVRAVEVSVNIPHTYIGDLIVELRHGVKTVRLHNRTGGTAENLVATYPPTPVDGPGTLSDFVNDPSNGTWTLFVSDNANIDVGNLAQWCLTLTGPADSSAIVAVEPQDQIPDVAWLAPGQPNPLGASGTTIRFALPASVPARLAVYDVTGRLVRTLVDRALPAGPHRVVWDGRDQHGAAVRPGVYLYRLRAGSFAAARRLVVIR
jgi:subtilisin-like proprotein convertase family protein